MPTFVPPALLVIAALVAAVLFAIVPTCLYLYVEPRGRRRWARAGDRPETRRAPRAVRFAAWFALACAQLAVVCVGAAVACGGLVYVQLRLGVRWPLGLVGSGALGLAALAQGAAAAQLAPLGLRLLVRDARAPRSVRASAMRQLVVTAVLVGAEALCTPIASRWAALAPKLLHPWLRAALLWTALRPVEIVAAACIVAVATLWACGAAVAAKPDAGES